MQTKRLSESEGDIKLAGEILRNGGLVAFPTETVYGLGANALDAEAVGAVYKAKGRPSDNPMIVHIADIGDLGSLVRGGRDGIGRTAAQVMEAFWPGPLTLIFPKSSAVPDATTGGLETVAIRMPSNDTAHRLISEAGIPIAAPSANISGKPSPTTSNDVLEDMDGRIDAVIMGENCEVGIESTVLDLSSDRPVILRPGVITSELISEIIGQEVFYDDTLLGTPGQMIDPQDQDALSSFKPKSPGVKYTHYAPKAKVRLIEVRESDFTEKVSQLEQELREQGLKSAILNYNDNAKQAAKNLFADLRELDRQKYDVIFIKTLDKSGLGFSVMNRMLKSAGYDIIR
ncbi:MAG TPA: threonylcarbamoyl-AMP synthase [Mogibacterium sp.]|nr:threonylcarbamoyl-AMP synthase [Mogibacterium sp.]